MKPIILLVEDDKNDIFLMKRAFGKASVPAEVRIATDGREALRYLLGQGQYACRWCGCGPGASAKLQTPNSKPQRNTRRQTSNSRDTPSTEHQAPEKIQIQILKRARDLGQDPPTPGSYGGQGRRGMGEIPH